MNKVHYIFCLAAAACVAFAGCQSLDEPTPLSSGVVSTEEEEEQEEEQGEEQGEKQEEEEDVLLDDSSSSDISGWTDSDEGTSGEIDLDGTTIDVSEYDYEVVRDDITDEDLEDATVEDVSSITMAGDYEAGVTYTLSYSTEADFVGFLTDEQKEALYEAIESLTEDNTTAYIVGLSASAKGIAAYASTGLQIAKAVLNAAVEDYASLPGYGTSTVSFILSSAATQITVNYYKTKIVNKVTFTTTVEGTAYTVIGEQTMYTGTTLTSVSSYNEGTVDIEDSYTGHGDDTNSGGGTSSE